MVFPLFVLLNSFDVDSGMMQWFDLCESLQPPPFAMGKSPYNVYYSTLY